MYTVLSVVCPITVVRVLIFRSAEAKVEKHIQIRTSAREKKQRNRRVTAGLLKNDANTLPNKRMYDRNSNLLLIGNGQFHIEFCFPRLATQRAPSGTSGRLPFDVSPQNAPSRPLLEVLVERMERHLPGIRLARQ